MTAIVPGLIEEDGTCKLSVIADGLAAAVSGPAAPDASSMSCGQLSVASPSAAAGSVTVQVAYEPSTAAGSSASTAVPRT